VSWVDGHAARSVKFDVLDDRGWLRVQCWLPEHRAGARAVMLGGRELPLCVGDSLTRDWRALCLGPADWLIVADAHTIPHIREELASEGAEQGIALVELTHAFIALEVLGSASRDLLSKGCGVDLHPRNFAPRQCTRTRFAQIPMIIECTDESRFELSVARSYLSYLRSWLADAAREFQ
jgi:sarcosine oxidase subunit gamma